MTCKEQQEEELEVLMSIYDGDECFHQVDGSTFQYKIGEDQTPKSFVLEVKWTEEYPSILPDINLDAFYNKHVLPDVKLHIVDTLKEEATQYLESAMTYTVFEYVKENAEDLLKDQPDQMIIIQPTAKDMAPQQDSKKKERKEQLTKAQKRKMADRMDNKGERPRGWDWVDIVKHLSQTGGKHES